MNKNKFLASLLLLSMVSAQGASLTAFATEVAEEANTDLTVTNQSTDETSSSSSEDAEADGSATQATGSTTVTEAEAKPTETSSEAQADTSADDQPSQPSTETSSSTNSSSSETQPSSTESSTSSSTDSATLPSSSSQAKTKEQTPPVSNKVPSAQPEASQRLVPNPIQATLTSPVFGVTDISAPSVIASSYVEHWSGKDAYSHHLLSRRYGIKAEQLDGFLKSTGIAYDSNRVNGKKLLEWEQKSGLDVRAIVAIAIAESSLGTAGVAKEGANMFGYGAFDNNPNNALLYNDEVAIQRLTTETIIQQKNTSFQIQDQKASNLALGQLSSADGGVYFTDASGTGQRRAQIMERLDQWIDAHGGTPEIPEELRNLATASISAPPAGYSLPTAVNPANYIAITYPWGECTWYVYNRAQELGYSFGPYMGNGGDWKAASGYELSRTPKAGYAVSFSPGQAGADGTYGHVAIVEQVKEDGSILISESNALGRGVVSYRTFTAEQAKELTYVIGKQISTDKN